MSRTGTTPPEQTGKGVGVLDLRDAVVHLVDRLLLHLDLDLEVASNLGGGPRGPLPLPGVTFPTPPPKDTKGRHMTPLGD